MLFLPGVGAFPKAINSLKKLKIYAIKKEVKKRKNIRNLSWNATAL